MKFSSRVGVLDSEEKTRFERLLFRSTRGNCLARFAKVDRPISDPASGNSRSTVVFIILFKSEVIGTIVDKICYSFDAHQYPIPDHANFGHAERFDVLIQETMSELADAQALRHVQLHICLRILLF